MRRRLKKSQEAVETDEAMTARVERLELEMRVIKDDLESIRVELGDRIEEVRKAINEALTP
jgi:predicted nuclease with TOPRIM domain